MQGNRKRHDAATKAKVAIEALKWQRTVNELATAYVVHPNLVLQWKKHAMDQLPEIFSSGRVRKEQDAGEIRDQLYPNLVPQFFKFLKTHHLQMFFF